MLPHLKTVLVSSLFAAIFFSAADFNQVSARVPDNRSSIDRSRGRGDSYSHDGWRRDGYDRDHWRGGSYGAYYYGGPGYYGGYVTPDYSNDYYSAPYGYDNSYASPQQMDNYYTPDYQQMDGNASYNQPMYMRAPGSQLMQPMQQTQPMLSVPANPSSPPSVSTQGSY